MFNMEFRIKLYAFSKVGWTEAAGLPFVLLDV